MTRPVQDLAEAARRMREGVYNEPINIRTADEFGELAGSFNAMQEAIGDRERRIVPPGASRQRCRGLPNRELVVGLLREAIARNEKIRRREPGPRPLRRHRLVAGPSRRRRGHQARGRRASRRVGEQEVLGPPERHTSSSSALPGRDAREAVEWIEFEADALRAGVRVSNANISLQVTGGVACYPEHMPARRARAAARRARAARRSLATRRRPIYRLGQDDRALQQIRIVGDFRARYATASCASTFSRSSDLDDRRDLRRRGARALAAPRARPAVPRRVHRGRRASRQHRAPHALGAARSRRALRAMEQQGVRLGVAVNISVDDLTDEYLPYYLARARAEAPARAAHA